uniref:Uncharacterized protein n=1 Tax=Phytophthora ramorum TaxID=164328 RepID=H3GVX2_PHYRM
MDDGADEDDREVEPDFCFNVDPDDDDFAVSDDLDHHADEDSARSLPNDEPASQAAAASGCADVFVTGTYSSCRGHFQDLLTTTTTNNELANYPSTTSSSPTSGVSQSPTQQQPPARLRGDQAEPKPSKYHKSSNRLGGADLTTLRETVGSKRSFEGDKDLLEASFAKAKRLRAIKTTTALETKLAGIETSTSSMGGSIIETIMLLREEKERKAEARRADDEQRCRDEVVIREARFMADKAEAEERRHQDKLDMEERARRDKYEAHARTQELLLLIGTLTKKG